MYTSLSFAPRTAARIHCKSLLDFLPDFSRAQVKRFEGLGHSLSFDELLEFRSFIADRCLPGGGQGYGTAPLDSRQSLIGRRWGDGSPVSDKAGGVSDLDLKNDAEKALGEFAESWTDPSREVWRYHLKRAP